MINSHIHRFSNELRGFVGYYDGFVNDLFVYMKEHAPKIRNIQQNTNTSDYKCTLGDIYTMPCLDADSIRACIKASKKRISDEELGVKIQAILNIPEIYTDLSAIPRAIFDGILSTIKKSEDKLTKTESLILECLYQVVNLNYSLEKSKKCFSICKELSDALEEKKLNSDEVIVINPEGNTIKKIISEEELYIEAYKAMVLFYKYAPYFYKKENNSIEERVLGKDVIVDQKYIKCEAIINKNFSRLA